MGICTYTIEEINMISATNTKANKELFFELLDHIQDENVKREYLFKVKDMVLNTKTASRALQSQRSI
jgi:hypothetical protein